ncbi:MAG TPA: hypothetical protein VGF96_01750 [Terracidiphilus sp.]|jgi:hypothetical protein
MRQFQSEMAIVNTNVPHTSHWTERARFNKCAVAAFGTIGLVMFVLPVHAAAQTNRSAHRSNLEFRSSDARLVKSFNWAKRQALAYVFDGDPVGPWYEAALPGRRAFCMRDVSHQAAGAQALGLSQYTHNMLHRFADNISASKDWCSYWEINYLNQPAPVDYKNDKEFWYNLPANFDVLDACYRMYLWTGDKSYIDDPAFLNFYHRTVTSYVERWDLGLDHIMARENGAQSPPYFHGDPSYEESRRDMVLGVDMLATQYAGYRSFAAIQAIRGDWETAQMYLRSAADVKSLVNSKWWNPSGNCFYGFLDSHHQFQGRAGADLLYRDVVDDGPKAQSALDNLLKSMRDEPASAVEPESHYAEILYQYDDPEAAYAEIMDLTRPGRERQEYPEVSYSVIGAIVNGLMGINVEPDVSIEEIEQGKHFATVVRTLPQLTRQTAWAELRNLPVGGGSITVRHDGERKTVLTNHEETVVDWEAVFPGSFATLIVNGKSTKAHNGSRYFGHALTWVRVLVQPGKSARVEVQN